MLRKAVLIIAVVSVCDGKAVGAAKHDLISVISNATGGIFNSVKQTIAANLHNYTFAADVVPGVVRNVTHILGYEIPPPETEAFPPPPPPQKPKPYSIFDRMMADPVVCKSVPDNVDSLAKKLKGLKPDEVSKLIEKLDQVKDKRIIEKLDNRSAVSGIFDRIGGVTPGSYFETTELDVSEVPVTPGGFFETTALNRSVEKVTGGRFFETTALHQAEKTTRHTNFFETTELNTAETQSTPSKPGKLTIETTTTTPAETTTQSNPSTPSKLTIETTTTTPTTIPTQTTTIETKKNDLVQTKSTPLKPSTIETTTQSTKITSTTQKNLLNDVFKDLMASLKITTTEAAPKTTKQSKKRLKQGDEDENPFSFNFDSFVAEVNKKVKEDAEKLKLDKNDDKIFHFG